jgi:hypothetical protein
MGHDPGRPPKSTEVPDETEDKQSADVPTPLSPAAGTGGKERKVSRKGFYGGSMHDKLRSRRSTRNVKK